MNDEYISVHEAAKKLGVSQRTIQRYCKEKRLNYIWIQGKRHKEIRILPPIAISQLPVGRKKNIAGAFDYITKTVFDETTFELKRKIEEKERHIAALEMQIAELKAKIEKAFEKNGNQSNILSDNKQAWEKIKNFIDEFEKIRPTEKKLILKIAGEVKTLREYLESLGMKAPENI